jgi:hypothetical protein
MASHEGETAEAVEGSSPIGFTGLKSGANERKLIDSVTLLAGMELRRRSSGTIQNHFEVTGGGL